MCISLIADACKYTIPNGNLDIWAWVMAEYIITTQQYYFIDQSSNMHEIHCFFASSNVQWEIKSENIQSQYHHFCAYVCLCISCLNRIFNWMKLVNFKHHRTSTSVWKSNRPRSNKVELCKHSDWMAILLTHKIHETEK